MMVAARASFKFQATQLRIHLWQDLYVFGGVLSALPHL